MIRRSVITLHANTPVKNAHGVYVDEETTRDVPCGIESVQRQDFTEAGRSGHSLQCVAVVPSMSYQGEDKATLNGDVYNVYRTYERARNQTELYLEKRGGTHG